MECQWSEKAVWRGACIRFLGGEGRQTNNKRSAVVRVAPMFFRVKPMFILLSGYLDDTGPKGCRGLAESPLQAAGKVNFVVCEPLPGA